MFFRYGAFASIQSLWAGPFLIEFLRLSPITAGNILLLLNLGYSFGAPCGGYVSDQLLRSRKKTVYYAYTIAACATLVLAELHGSLSLALLAGVFFIIGFVNAFNQISFIHAKELMPDQISGSAMTGTNFFGMMGAGFFIHGLGLIFDNPLLPWAPGPPTATHSWSFGRSLRPSSATCRSGSPKRPWPLAEPQEKDASCGCCPNTVL